MGQITSVVAEAFAFVLNATRYSFSSAAGGIGHFYTSLRSIVMSDAWYQVVHLMSSDLGSTGCLGRGSDKYLLSYFVPTCDTNNSKYKEKKRNN